MYLSLQMQQKTLKWREQLFCLSVAHGLQKMQRMQEMHEGDLFLSNEKCIMV